MENNKFYRKKLFKIIVIILFSLLGLYMLISLYFINHFYFGSEINSISISGKTLEEVDKEVQDITDNYTLKVVGRNNIEEEIKGNDIDLKYDIKNNIEEMRNSQNPLMWITILFKNYSANNSEGIIYNKEKLNSIIDNLEFFNDKKVIDPKSAYISIKDGKSEVINEVNGCKLNKEKLVNQICEAIKNGEKTININSDSYIRPKYISTSEKLLQSKSIIDKYLNTTIDYNFCGETYCIDKETIGKWINIGEDNNVSIDEKLVSEVASDLARKFNTVGKERSFKTSNNTNIKVSGGDYGWRINVEEETKSIIKLLEEGKIVDKEPCFEQCGLVASKDDIGNSYVEIDLSSQHLWLYKDGKMISDGSVVTGNMSNGCATPSGVYKLDFKQRNATLRGTNYASFVNFWMPFNLGIGIHDASWRGSFGGTIYKTNGSHGCVNAPYNLAKIVYENIDVGTPIICYY